MLVIGSLLVGVGLLPFAAHFGAVPYTSPGGYHLLRASSSQSVNLTVSDQGYAPTNVAVNATANVTFHVRNTASEAQTFTIVDRNDTMLPFNDTPAQLNKYCWANCTRFANATIPSGTWYNASLTFPKPTTPAGVTYEFLSLVPDEYQSYPNFQFWGTITVNPTTGPFFVKIFVNATNALTFVPDILTAPSHVPIVVDVLDGGLPHTFTLDALSNDTGLTSGTSVGTYFASGCGLTTAHATLVNSCVNTLNGDNPTDPFVAQAGVYSFVCLVPGHFPSMWGHLYVGITPQPPSSVPQITGVIGYGYLALGAIVIVGAAFLVLMGQNEATRAAAAASHEH